VAVSGQGREEAFDFHGAHFQRVAFPVEEDVSFDPLQISLLCPQAVMLKAETVTKLIKQFGRLPRHIRFIRVAGSHIGLVGQSKL